MEGWMFFWKLLFIASITLFSGMAVWVIIKGARDIRRLIDSIRKNGENQ